MSNYVYACKSESETNCAITYLINMGYEDKRCSVRDNHIMAFECGGMKQILSYDCDTPFHRLAYQCKSLSDFKEFVNCQSKISELKLKLRCAIRNAPIGEYKKFFELHYGFNGGEY